MQKELLIQVASMRADLISLYGRRDPSANGDALRHAHICHLHCAELLNFFFEHANSHNANAYECIEGKRLVDKFTNHVLTKQCQMEDKIERLSTEIEKQDASGTQHTSTLSQIKSRFMSVRKLLIRDQQKENQSETGVTSEQEFNVEQCVTT